MATRKGASIAGRSSLPSSRSAQNANPNRGAQSASEDQKDRTEKGKKILLMIDALSKYQNAISDLQIQAQNALDSTTMGGLASKFKTYRNMLNTAKQACQSSNAISNYDKVITAGENAMDQCNKFGTEVKKQIATVQKNAKNSAAAKGRSTSLR